MIEPGISDPYNDCQNILDYDDSDVLMSNNFETQSFKDNDNIKNGDINSNYFVQYERHPNDKVVLQNQYNSKVVDLQSQVMKLTNNFERVETTKTELEVELAKSQKELRQILRNFKLKSNELENIKNDLSNQMKLLESDYLNKITHSNNINKSLQDQIYDEKRNNKNNQEIMTEKVNQLFQKIHEKEEELSRSIYNQNALQNTIMESQLKLDQFSKKIEEYEQLNSNNLKQINEKNLQIDSLKVSEMKLKILVSELTNKINQLDSKIFEEKQELNESRNYQSNLQAQLLELQQQQINKEKEYNLLLDRVCNSNTKIKELEEALNNQIQLSATYNEHLKKFENKHKMQNFDIKDQNDNLHKRVAQLEETIQIQNRIIEETNEELSTSREGEGVAVSNLTLTLEELDKLIEEPKLILQSPIKQSHYNKSSKCHQEFYNETFLSPPNSLVIQKAGDLAKNPSPNKRVLRNIKQVIHDFQERLISMDAERLEGLDKIQHQEKEIKNLKVQLRKHQTQNKALEINYNEKQNEIENLTDEISKLKSVITTLKSESNKNQTTYKENIDNFKNAIVKLTQESQNGIENRDNYLQNISLVIKEALQNSLSSYLDKSPASVYQYNQQKTNSDSFGYEIATQTRRINSNIKDNLELSGNLTGTFCFSNQNHTTTNESNAKLMEKQRTRSNENNVDKKLDVRQSILTDDKKKSAPRKNVKLSESKKESYLDSSQSWPALREVISNELSSLLNKYDQQKSQCHHLMSELSAKENLISRLLSYQNSNNQVIVESSSCDPQDNGIEISTINNKAINKSFSNQNNVQSRSVVDSKKKSKLLVKSKIENITSNVASKKCNKLDNQKPCCNIQMNQTEKPVPTNKKATITSIKTQDKSFGNPLICNSIIEITKNTMRNLSVKKLTTISLPSTPPVTSKFPEIVDETHLVQSGQIVDRRLIWLFVGVIVNYINLRAELDFNLRLIHFYRLLYHRSIDCSKLISINDHIESIINHSNNTSKSLLVKRKNKKLKIFVHVILICRYMCKNVLATKLMVNVDTEVMRPDDYVIFFNDILNCVTKSSDSTMISKESVDVTINSFVSFCMEHNNRQILITNFSSKLKNNIFSPSNTIVLDQLKRNVNTIQTIIQSQISKKYSKTKYQFYQNNIQTLIIKIKELGEIIDNQNSLITIREKTIDEYKEMLHQKNDEFSQIQNLMKQRENLYQKQCKKKEKMKLLIIKTKSYLSNMINKFEQCMNCDIFNFDQLMKDEELIYVNLRSEDSDDFIDFVRDGIRGALRLSCSVKSILI